MAHSTAPLPLSTRDASVAHPDEIRASFSRAMSAMYRAEVPQYGTLLELVAGINARTLEKDDALKARLAEAGELEALSEERHGAIRVGTASELHTIRRMFAVMGMLPVAYYDLTAAGVPVHSTAFRPVSPASLSACPFRIFTSLLRADLIADADLRRETEAILAARHIFTPRCLQLIEAAERDGGLSPADAAAFVAEAVETFRWHPRAAVPKATYDRLTRAHRLVADIASFAGPHINHLTPRTLDIDAVQDAMPGAGMARKEVVEGPPRRACPILLRQTSFLALQEPVLFSTGKAAAGGVGASDSAGAADSGAASSAPAGLHEDAKHAEDAVEGWTAGSHTARFGEIEERGVALTPAGRMLYDALLEQARAASSPAPAPAAAAAEVAGAATAGSTVAGAAPAPLPYTDALASAFKAFPDTWTELRRGGLAYFTYHLTALGRGVAAAGGIAAAGIRIGSSSGSAGAATGGAGASTASPLASLSVDSLIDAGLLAAVPQVYQDFLPVSAAGIFQSNLHGAGAAQGFSRAPAKSTFEAALGAKVLNEFELYASAEAASLANCLSQLSGICAYSSGSDSGSEGEETAASGSGRRTSAGPRSMRA